MRRRHQNVVLDFFILFALNLLAALEGFPLVPPPSSSVAFCTKTSTFRRLSASPDLNAFDMIGEELQLSLSMQLGVLEPNEVQNSSLPFAVRGENIFVIAQTGSGKTLTFLLPILHHLNNTFASSPSQMGAIVIGPTAELMAQHYAIAKKLAPTLVKRVLFKTPEQVISDLKSPLSSNAAEYDGIKIVAIDEVDAVLCSNEFNSTVPESSIELLNLLPDQAQYIMTTAHLNRAHTKALNQLFPQIKMIRQGGSSQSILVPTLRQEFHYFTGNISEKLEKLESILQKAEDNPLRAGQSTIIFCDTDNGVELVHSFLEKSPLSKAFAPRKLHVRMEPNKRSDALSDFQTNPEKCRLLVTHEIAARGLDCPLVRHVILFDTPKDVTAFVHRAGRTARAGEDGTVTCLVQAGTGFNGGGSFGQHKQLHALQDAPKLNFKKVGDVY
jgi:superfamily II DNA/RNA helicase